MQTHQRSFRGAADIQEMIARAQAFPEDSLHVVDLPYRLSSWAIDFPENVGLWIDVRGELVAWAVLQSPFWTIDYAFHRGAGASIHRQILGWADGRARQILDTASGRPCWFVMVFESQMDRHRELEAAGFTCQSDVGEDSWSKVLMARAAGDPIPRAALPEGFVVRTLAGESEVEAYVELHQTVFESRSMTAEWRARTLRCPEYIPELDLVAAAPDGRLAGFCSCWLQRGPQGASAQIEPLGVRADFRHLGLGRAVLLEALRRAYSMGAQQIYVETDNYREGALGLYQSAGFRIAQEVLVYRKDYQRG
jgi:ribosomal protein S18 acetylase RimI-like enzyme